ncbi:MAG: aspartoacylase, partial [Merismopedia sp. SIO2A8]|nr:aspartoacylase [Merismopedia sp. SIO2A8]
MQPIRNVLIVGGVHGNELNGIHLVKKFEHPSYRSLIQRSHLSVSTLLANPRAITNGQRYVDVDLNRCFDRSDLSNPALDNWEQQRAKVIALQVKNRPTDFLIDLHTSTANMGLTLLLSSNHPVNLAIAAHLSDRYSFVKVLQVTSQPSNSRLRSLC